MPAVSETIKQEVLKAIPYGGGIVQHIWLRMPRWSRITMKHALREMVADGRVSFHGPDGRRWYWRTADGVPKSMTANDTTERPIEQPKAG